MAFAALPARIHAGLWRADQIDGGHGLSIVASGHAALDAELPGGGWPLHALTELLPTRPGVGEIRLLAPALRVLSAAGRNVILLGAPHLPYGPALQTLGLQLEHLLVIHAAPPADLLWALEQTLKSASFGAVLAWLPQVRSEQLRRLQLAAQGSNGLVFLFRPLPVRHESSPAPLRLVCSAARTPEGERDIRKLAVEIVKRRGPALEAPLLIDLQQPLAAARTVRPAANVKPASPRIPASTVVSHALDRTRVSAPAARSLLPY